MAWLVSLIAFSMWTAGPALAQESDEEFACGNLTMLERAAFKARLTEEQRACIDAEVRAAAPGLATRASFMLITNAFMKDEQATYAALLRRHLTEVNTSDADVAYMFGILLEQQQASAFERLRWVSVAIENRIQWTGVPQVYAERMKRLYQMRNEAAIETLVIAKNQYEASPSPALAERMAGYKQRASAWTREAAPCLVYDDCAPVWEARVIEPRDCEDLDRLEGPADSGRLTDREIGCLKGRWERQPASRARLMDLLMRNAAASGELQVWQDLLSWSHNQTGAYPRTLAMGYARVLSGRGEVYASEVIRWADVVINRASDSNRASAKRALVDALTMRMVAQRDVVLLAERAHAGASSIETSQQLEEARARLAEFTAARARYCEDSGRCDPAVP